MAINDRFMLPKLVRTMDPMSDLLATEQAELDQTQRVIAAQERQLTISTSTYLVPRHERLFALPVNAADSLEKRRAVVLLKLNARSVTTVQAICDLVKLFTGQEGEVVEHFSQYAFSVLVKISAGSTASSIYELIRQIEEIKPAHLVFETIAVFPAFPVKFPTTPHLYPRVSVSTLPPPRRGPLSVQLRTGPVLGARISTVTLPMAAAPKGV